MNRRRNQQQIRRAAAARPQRTRSAVPAPPAGARKLVEIEKPIYGGAFLARAEGKAVFVPLSLPGEQARVRVVEDKRGYATAEVEVTLTSAAERTPPPCPYFGACGGCHYQHAQYEAQLRYKQEILRETLRRGGVRAPEDVEILSGEPWAYRNRIRLAFDAEGNPGYRGRRSHHLIAIEECPISAPVLVRGAVAFADVARRSAPKLKAKEIVLFCDAAENALLASVLCGQPAKIRVEEIASEVQERVPALRGVEFVAEDRAHGPQRFAHRGEDSLLYRAAGFEYRVDQGAFFQVNRWLLDGLVERVVAGHSGRIAWDLFAGVGLFARQLAAGYERVVAVESAPAATNALARNLRGTSGEAVRASTLEFLRRHDHAVATPDLIVVDPPRTGLGTETTQLLGDIAAPAIVYVSCDPATLARDLCALTASGYSIERVTLADLFPQTFHLETVVELRR